MADQLVGSPKEHEEEERRVAAILDRHLPEGYSAEPEVSLASEEDQPELARVDSPVPSVAGSGLPGSEYGRSGTPDNVESSLRLQGGDIHRDIFRIKARANSLRRSNTFSYNPSPRLHPDGLTYSDQLEPGGFRRHHVRLQTHHRSKSGPLVVANSFVDFLDLYGSFAGEDLDDTDSVSGDDESALDDGDGNEEEDGERRPLIRRPTVNRRRSSRRAAREGDASTLKTFFTLIKAFIGTGIMFLPKAFLNGGILFSSMTLISVSLITCLCFRLLLDCREKYGGGYGELGAAIGGPRLRKMILISIALSQLGFVCAGIIFTAENLWAFLDAVTKGRGSLALGVPALIGLQLIPLVPLALIRNISKLGPVALIADVFILIGLVYIWYFDAHTLITRGMEPSVELFNPSAFTLTIGSAIFTFEGIGLILPIQSSMKKPEHFSKLLYLVMFIITVIFTSVGALCYATFGDKTKIQVISNFPQSSALVNAVQFLYSLAVLAGEPVQLFPAVRIIETTLFGERATGKKSAAIKWQKNGVRTAVMALCIGISIVGASDLDKFVALIGSFACVPLVYIYPAYLHYRGAAETTREKVLDIVLMTGGLIAMVFTTTITVFQWIDSKV